MSCRVMGPGMPPSPMPTSLTLRTGQMQRLVEVRKASSALYASNRSRSCSETVRPAPRARAMTVSRLIPARTSCSRGVQRAPPRTRKMLLPIPSARLPRVSRRTAHAPVGS